MRKHVFTVFIFLTFLLPANGAAEKIVFALLEDFPPFQYRENGQILGSDVDLAREACKRLGMESDFQIMPWKRILKSAEGGQVGAVLSLLHNKERTEFLYYSTEPTHINVEAVMSVKGSNMKVGGLDDLKGKVVGVVAGYSYGPAFDSYQDFKKKEICDNQDTLIRILDKGRIDFAVAAALPFIFNCKKLGLEKRFETVYVIAENPTYTAFSKKAWGEKGKTLSEIFGATLRLLKEEGFVQKVTDKYR